MGAEFVLRLVMVAISLLFSPNYCTAIENITVSQELSQGQTLISPGEIFELGFFSPNNSGNHKYVGVWYKGISPQTVVWVANRDNTLSVTDSRASLKISNDGYLQLVNGNQSFIWATNVRAPSNSSVATLSDMGNFVLKDGMSGESLWQSFHHPGNTFLPSSVLGYDAKKGQNYALTSWKSDSDPSVGNFTNGISPKFKPAQGFIWRNGSTPHWRSGPWAGSKFIGLPEMDASYQSPFDLQEDAEQGTTYFTFKTINSSVLSRMFLSSEGVYSLMYKDVIGGDWYAVWMSPKNPCDPYGVCGPSGLCKYSEYPICRCLKGFVPKSNQEWSKGNWTQGCVRRTELLCEKNTSGLASQGGKKDGFHKFGNIKLPDFYEYVYPPNDIDTCQTWCLDNCSCSACAYVNGIGCLIWSEGFFDIQEFAVGGEDFFLRLAPEELVGGQNNKNIIIIIVATVSCVVTLGAILLIGWHRRRAKKKSK